MADSEFHNVISWGDERNELEKIQSKFIKYFPQNGEILDLGSGRGIFLRLLKKHGFRPIGVEYDETMYKESTSNGFIVHKDDVISYLSKTNKKFDGIMASHIIEHMSAEEGIKFIRLIKEHLKPGGVTIIVTPRPGSLWAAENFWLDTTHIRPYPYELMKQLLKPLQIIAGGIEPDSYVLKDSGYKVKLIAKFRRLLFGRDLYDFVYAGGVWYIVGKNEK